MKGSLILFVAVCGFFCDAFLAPPLGARSSWARSPSTTLNINKIPNNNQLHSSKSFLLFLTQSRFNDHDVESSQRNEKFELLKHNPLTVVRSKALAVGVALTGMISFLFPQKAWAMEVFNHIANSKYSLIAATVKSAARRAAINKSKASAGKLPLLPTSSVGVMMPTLSTQKFQIIAAVLIVISLFSMFVVPMLVSRFKQKLVSGTVVPTDETRETISRYEEERKRMIGKPRAQVVDTVGSVKSDRESAVKASIVPKPAASGFEDSRKPAARDDNFKYTPITTGKTYSLDNNQDDLPASNSSPAADIAPLVRTSPPAPTATSSTTSFTTPSTTSYSTTSSGKKEIHPRVAEILNRKKLQTLTGISEGGAVATSSAEETVTATTTEASEPVPTEEAAAPVSTTFPSEQEDQQVVEVAEVAVAEPAVAASAEVPSFAVIMPAPEESLLPPTPSAPVAEEPVADALVESAVQAEEDVVEAANEPAAAMADEAKEAVDNTVTEKEEDDDDDNDAEEVVSEGVVEESPITSSAFVSTSLPSDSSQDNQKPGLLGRLFSKSSPTTTASETRPNALSVTFPLEAKDLDFRIAVYTLLQRYLLPETTAVFDSYFQTHAVPTSKKPAGLETWKKKFSWKLWAKLSVSEAAIGFEKMLSALGLSLTEGGVIFAAIVNMIIVQSIDDIVQLDATKQTEFAGISTPEDKKAFQKEHELLIVQKLDSLYEAMNHIGNVFVKAFPGCSITPPIQYNGLQKKELLEQVLLKYLKVTTLGGGGFGLDPAATTTPPDANAAVPAIDSQERELRAGRLQYLLGISEARKTILDQKVMKELMFAGMGMPTGGDKGVDGGADDELLMKLMGGQAEPPKKGGLGGLVGGLGKGIVGGIGKGIASGIGNALTGGKFGSNAASNPFASLSGLPGADSLPDLKAMEEMMKSDPKGFQEKMKSSLGGLNPEEVMDMSLQAMESIKVGLENGSFTKADVLEFEKASGMEIEKLFSSMTGGAGGRVDLRQLRQANPKAAEIVEVFQQMMDLKNR